MQVVAPSYAPSPRQSAFHQDPRARRWFCAGYGSGKTTAAVWEAWACARTRHPGYTGIVAAPTFQLLTQAWLAEWARQIPRAYWRQHGSPGQGGKLLVRTEDGRESSILLRSTSIPWSNEGINAAWLVFDEATRERDRSAYDVLLARVRHGRPGIQRTVVLTGPPMARRHWTALEYGAGRDAAHDGDASAWHDRHHAVIRARTRDNTRLPPGYEAALRARPGATRAWCRQFLDAEFGALEGAVYPAFSRDVHVVPAASLVGRRWRRVVVGVDWGWAHPGVMLAVGVDGIGDAYVLAEEVHRQRVVADTADGWVPIAQRLARTYRPERFACDPSQPGHVETVYRGVRALGVRVHGADNDVAEGIRCVAARLEAVVERGVQRRPGLYVSSACAHVIEEFESYAFKRSPGGEPSESPVEVGDDAMDALRYAVIDL